MIKEFLERYDDGSFSFPDVKFRSGAKFTLDFGIYSKSIGDFTDQELYFKDNRRLYFHCGVDRGYGEIFAPFDGRIEFDHNARAYGTMMTLFPNKADFIVRVAHMADIAESVKRNGLIVKRGDLIGITGSKGLGTGAHSHTEIVSIVDRSEIIETIIREKEIDGGLEYYQFLYPHLTPEDKFEWDNYARARDIVKFNKLRCIRQDGYRGGYNKVTYYNSRLIFGM